jgi:penicillin-binding protein 2
VAYATIGKGGDVVRPHVAMQVEDPSGRVVQEVAPAPRRHVDIDPVARDTIMDGLRGAAMAPGGTSYAVFGGFPVDIAGKTGTAETASGYDQSWYVALAPAHDPQYVVAVTIERGGFGAEAAAPATRQILTPLLDVKQRQIDAAEAGAAAGGAYD